MARRGIGFCYAYWNPSYMVLLLGSIAWNFLLGRWVSNPADERKQVRLILLIDFWARWHITLTRFLTLYLFNPVAMRVSRRRAKRGQSSSRKGTRNLPAFLSLVVWPTVFTMTLAGIWHGAGLQFIVFGVLHAIYLSVNHAWRIFGPQHLAPSRLRAGIFVLMTYGCVLVGQIFFCADSLNDAGIVLKAMAGHALGFDAPGGLVRIIIGFAICLILPNTQQIMREYRPVLEQVPASPWHLFCWQCDLRLSDRYNISDLIAPDV
jgi:alginate O-acetyltransferase complex protein AlgI